MFMACYLWQKSWREEKEKAQPSGLKKISENLSPLDCY